VNLRVERRQLESVLRSQIRQIMVCYLIRSTGMAVQRRQIVRDSFRFSFRSKPFQDVPGALHSQTNSGFIVGADLQESEFGNGAEDNLLAGQPISRTKVQGM